MVDVKSEVYYIHHDPVLGWMSPDGQLIVCPYAGHEMAAKDIVQISGRLDDWMAEYVNHPAPKGTRLVIGSGRSRDSLVD